MRSSACVRARRSAAAARRALRARGVCAPCSAAARAPPAGAPPRPRPRPRPAPFATSSSPLQRRSAVRPRSAERTKSSAPARSASPSLARQARRQARVAERQARARPRALWLDLRRRPARRSAISAGGSGSKRTAWQREAIVASTSSRRSVSRTDGRTGAAPRASSASCSPPGRSSCRRPRSRTRAAPIRTACASRRRRPAPRCRRRASRRRRSA